MGLSPQWLDELRARTTLSALIGRTVRITRAGREYKACCPFHDEKSPSFTINDEKGFYHCFGCSAHGDAIRWMTDQRGLSFMDAVKELAAEAGMDVPAPDPKAAKRAETQAGLHDVMAAAQEQFVANLSGVEGAIARDYLAKRGIKPETIKQFGIGYSLDSRKALRQELKRFGDPMLIEAGMLILVDDKEPYDRFRGRLMIPIRDARGRVIAFGGRILGAGEPKYLNSPDTPLFDKGRTLYNLDKASPASRSTGRIVVAEGYLDVIAMAQAGFHDVVAPLGTALTENQIQMLWRLADKPIVCFDGDNAGKKAASRAANRALPLLKPGFSLRFVDLPPGQDPDDIIKSNGKAVMASLIENAHDLDQQIWEAELDIIPIANPGPDDRAALKDRLEKAAKTIENANVSKEYERSFLNKFYDRFGFKKKSIADLSTAMKDAFQRDINVRDFLTQRGVYLGLSLYPNVIRKSFNKILELPTANNEIKKMKEKLVATVLNEPDIEVDILEQMWATEIDPPIAPRDLTYDLAFSFFKRHKDKRKPESDLYLVINAIVHDYQTEQAMARSEANLKEDLNDASFAEHTKILKEKRASRDRLMEAISAAADQNSASEAA
jgi:DNA primase